MKYGLFSGCLWGLDTVILGIALTMVPFIGTAEALALGAIVSSALHDVCCALWLLLYMGVRGRLKDTLAALKTRSGKVVVLGALLGGPIGMTGYVIAINNIGAGYTAIISSFYPAFGTLMAVLLLKEKITPGRVVALIVVLPIFGAWAFTWNAIPNPGTAVVALAALAGTCSYLFYYKGISVIGAARGMALNISYSAWAVLFGLILLGTVPGPVEIVCCIAILCGTILAACDWGELFGTKKAGA